MNHRLRVAHMEQAETRRRREAGLSEPLVERATDAELLEFVMEYFEPDGRMRDGLCAYDRDTADQIAEVLALGAARLRDGHQPHHEHEGASDD